MRHPLRTPVLTGAALGLLGPVALAAPALAADADSADLYVLHGVPDTTVDVYVNGERTLDDFTPGTLTGPLDLPTGTYTVAITAADAADASAPVIGPVDLSLTAGNSYTAVAHLKEDGSPTATLFTNDISSTDAGQGRLTVRHTAAAPAVDILAGGSPVLEDVTNPNEGSLDLPAGTVSAAVALAGTTAPVIGPADVPVQDGTLTVVYAWGSASAGNLQLAVQNIGGLHSAPSGVDSGQAGLVADDATSTGGVAAGAAALVALAGVAALGLRRRTARVTAGR
ncbi:DUF4397 domain-containing protein [Cellulomonas marina]|uniref:DUF4397 domain-containing protein n=1 Tax=Cellulomonas marina TaxID=988821 RepID=A0A1I0Y3H2_9CELL|nr:DUF4397 domain-containing protein [Cellulomonas marina]GIG29769.1 lipoprotein [Cellulomonas marina]SFB07712.1 protein of unknown function [Cellulomonas marina]